MNENDFGVLPTNLLETYAALNSSRSDEKSLPLIAVGTRLYYSGSWLGKIIETYDSYANNRSKKTDRLKSALAYTINDLFETKVRQVYQAYQRYARHLVYLN